MGQGRTPLPGSTRYCSGEVEAQHAHPAEHERMASEHRVRGLTDHGGADYDGSRPPLASCSVSSLMTDVGYRPGRASIRSRSAWCASRSRTNASSLLWDSCSSLRWYGASVLAFGVDMSWVIRASRWSWSWS